MTRSDSEIENMKLAFDLKCNRTHAFNNVQTNYTNSDPCTVYGYALCIFTLN